MLSTREKQSLFAHNLAKLILFLYSHPGVACTFGDVARMDKQGHSANSLHYIRLAADINLFVLEPNPRVEGGMIWRYVEGDHPMWKILGDYWKSLHPLNRHGGDFKAKDFNHFSMTEGGFS
jgi:hypothetical protein